MQAKGIHHRPGVPVPQESEISWAPGDAGWPLTERNRDKRRNDCRCEGMRRKDGARSKLSGIASRNQDHHPTMRSNFGNYSRMLETCGLEREGAGFRVGMRTLFLDWAGLARKLGKLPTIKEYDANSRFSVMPLTSRFGGWKQAPVGALLLCPERRTGYGMERCPGHDCGAKAA